MATPDRRGIAIGRRVVSLGEITCYSVSPALWPAGRLVGEEEGESSNS